jgi:hypothetical protein
MPIKFHMTENLRGDRGPDRSRWTRHGQRGRAARGGPPRPEECCPAQCRWHDRHTAHAVRRAPAERVQIPPPRIDGPCDERHRKLHSVPGPPSAVAGGMGVRMPVGEASQPIRIMARLGHLELALAASAAAGRGG